MQEWEAAAVAGEPALQALLAAMASREAELREKIVSCAPGLLVLPALLCPLWALNTSNPDFYARFTAHSWG